MCELVDLKVGSRNIRVANIKKDYIKNIIDNAEECKEIDRIVLFGSALEERCTDDSDVDIAIFGKTPKSKLFRKKSYNRFVDAVVSYGEIQDYDILYFDSLKPQHGGIMEDINRGTVLFERE